jgi:hypothetical protein
VQKKIEQLKYVTQFFPLRFNFFVFLALLFLIYRFANQSAVDTSSFHHFLILMSKIGFGIMLVILLISLLSTLAACFYFIRHREYFHVEVLNQNEDAHTPKIEVHTFMQKIFRPILGSIQVRYEYNEYQLSSSFILARENRFTFFPTMGHRSHIELPNIKEYKINAALLSFQDLFRFFSFTFKNSIQSRFVNLPKTIDTQSIIVEPKTTETDEVRTRQLRHIPGEWLEYKKYEASDDIRRIVWKAFAKNKELLVRKQEITSPYASHINCYASFYSEKLFTKLSSDAMADYYKNFIWSFYQQLTESDLQVRLHFEKMKKGLVGNDQIAEQISQAEWQKEIKPSRYMDSDKGAVLFLHSLLPTDEISTILAKVTPAQLVFYIDLRTIFSNLDNSYWWSRFFLRPKNPINEDLLSDWRSNPQRLGWEKEIESHINLLQDSLAKTEIIQ